MCFRRSAQCVFFTWSCYDSRPQQKLWSSWLFPLLSTTYNRWFFRKLICSSVSDLSGNWEDLPGRNRQIYLLMKEYVLVIPRFSGPTLDCGMLTKKEKPIRRATSALIDNETTLNESRIQSCSYNSKTILVPDRLWSSLYHFGDESYRLDNWPLNSGFLLTLTGDRYVTYHIFRNSDRLTCYGLVPPILLSQWSTIRK